jgi:hypothetical protein
MRRGWDSVTTNTHWKQPYILENTVFNLQVQNYYSVGYEWIGFG